MISVVPSSLYPDAPRLEMLAFVPATTRMALDVGCHTGAFGRAIKEKTGATVWGVEPDPATAQVAAESLDRVFPAFFSADLDLPDQTFDVIVFNDVLEHMPDPWAALKLAARKITPNGCVVVSLPNLRHIDNLMHILRERDFRFEPRGIRDQAHLRFFTFKSAPRLFDGSGLTITAIEGVNELWHPSPLRFVARLLMKAQLEDTRHIQIAIVARPDATFAAHGV